MAHIGREARADLVAQAQAELGVTRGPCRCGCGHRPGCRSSLRASVAVSSGWSAGSRIRLRILAAKPTGSTDVTGRLEFELVRRQPLHADRSPVAARAAIAEVVRKPIVRSHHGPVAWLQSSSVVACSSRPSLRSHPRCAARACRSCGRCRRAGPSPGASSSSMFQLVATRNTATSGLSSMCSRMSMPSRSGKRGGAFRRRRGREGGSRSAGESRRRRHLAVASGPAASGVHGLRAARRRAAAEQRQHHGYRGASFDAHLAEHAQFHVQQHVAMERPAPQRVGADAIAAHVSGRHADGVLAQVEFAGFAPPGRSTGRADGSDVPSSCR